MKKDFSKKVIKHIRRLYSTKFIRFFGIHWLNPLYTVYFNFIFLPFRQAIRFPIFIYGWPRLYSQFGKIICIGKCTTGMVRINVTIPGGPQYSVGNTELNIWGTLIFRGKCEIGTGNRINVGEKGTLDLGDLTKITVFCNITAYSLVKIGEMSRIVHRCQVLDTNFHYIADFNNNVVKDIAKPIIIGRYCWICNSTTITGGSVIPDMTIVGSNSLVNKDFSSLPTESLIGGIPAKFIANKYRKIENRELEINIQKFYNNNPDDVFILPENIEHDCCDYK